MAFSLKSLFGAGGAQGQALTDEDFDEPTTQVKMSGTPKGYDPLGAVSIMEQMRTGVSRERAADAPLAHRASSDRAPVPDSRRACS